MPLNTPKSDGAKALRSDWKLLTVAALAYGALYLVTSYYAREVPEPQPAAADPSLFSEGRAMQHLHQLATVIGHRQVGSMGEEQAAQYLLREAQKIAAAAAETRPDLVVEAARESVNGGVTMRAFKFEITNVYRNLTNIVLRIAPADHAAAAKKAVLVNSHYDSTLGTVGASDAGSCVCVELELARTLVANPALRLAAPVVFLFNGGEETLMQASHGFFSSSRFAAGLGAFINLESTGPWGPDVVFQQAGSWVLAAYARSAPRPRGTTLAQDFFDLGLIPADTDYRMFSYRHHGTLPGIDIAFIFDGTAYHTARDEPARIRPGTLQGMGENVLAAILEFGRVLATDPPAPSANTEDDGGFVYFDLWGRAMVIYSHAQAKALHHAPLAILLLLPLLAPAFSNKSGAGAGTGSESATVLSWCSLAGNTLRALCSLLGALLVPAAVGAGRAWVSGVPMAWYGRPLSAYAIYLPAATVGLMLPYLPPLPSLSTSSKGRWQGQKQGLSQAAAGHSLGMAMLFALLCSGLTAVGMHSSFFYGLWAASAVVAAVLVMTSGTGNGRTSSSSTSRSGGNSGSSLGAAITLLLPFLPTLAIALPSTATFMAHIMEKVGLAGCAPGLLGLMVADATMGAVAGATMILSFGPLLPYLTQALGPRRGSQLVAALLAVSLAAASLASVVYRLPYSRDHPKRLLVQHIHTQGPDGEVLQSKLSVVGLDSFPLAPAIPSSFLALPAAEFRVEDWMSFYPLNYLISSGAARMAPGPEEVSAAPALRLLSRIRVKQVVAAGQDEEQGGANEDGEQGRSLGGGGGAGGDPAPMRVQRGGQEELEEEALGGSGGIAGDRDAQQPHVHERQQDQQQLGWRTVERLEFGLDTGKGGAWGVMNFTVTGRHSDDASDGSGSNSSTGGGSDKNSGISSGTGKVLAWSLSDKVADTELQQGGVSHMVRFAGNLHSRRYRFWLEVPVDASLAVQLYVKHVEESAAARQLLAQLPEWTSPAAVVTYQSSWHF